LLTYRQTDKTAWHFAHLLYELSDVMNDNNFDNDVKRAHCRLQYVLRTVKIINGITKYLEWFTFHNVEAKRQKGRANRTRYL